MKDTFDFYIVSCHRKEDEPVEYNGKHYVVPRGAFMGYWVSPLYASRTGDPAKAKLFATEEEAQKVVDSIAEDGNLIFYGKILRYTANLATVIQ